MEVGQFNSVIYITMTTNFKTVSYNSACVRVICKIFFASIADYQYC